MNGAKKWSGWRLETIHFVFGLLWPILTRCTHCLFAHLALVHVSKGKIFFLIIEAVAPQCGRENRKICNARIERTSWPMQMIIFYISFINDGNKTGRVTAVTAAGKRLCEEKVVGD